MEEKDIIKNIEDLVSGELSQEQEQKLMSFIKNDQRFIQLLNDEKDLVEGIKSWSRKELKERLRTIESTLKPVQLKKEASFKMPLLVAASVSILVALYFVFNSISPNSQELFNSYYEPYQSYAPVTMRGEQQELDDFEKAQFSYETGDYAKALPLFLSTESSDERDFFVAQTQLALNNQVEAIALFENLQKNDAHPKTTIKWFLALAYLKNENFDESKVLLTELSTSDNAYQERAKELLNSL